MILRRIRPKNGRYFIEIPTLYGEFSPKSWYLIEIARIYIWLKIEIKTFLGYAEDLSSDQDIPSTLDKKIFISNNHPLSERQNLWF